MLVPVSSVDVGLQSLGPALLGNYLGAGAAGQGFCVTVAGGMCTQLSSHAKVKQGPLARPILFQTFSKTPKCIIAGIFTVILICELPYLIGFSQPAVSKM